MKSRIFIVFFSLLPFHSFGQANANFSREIILEDLQYLYESLKEAHYNVYAYTSKEAFDSTYQAIKQSIVKDSMNTLEVINAFQPLTSAINNGHTAIEYPVQSYIEYASTGGTLFPLEIAFDDNKPLIRKNWSSNDSIKVGAEILSINGIPMADIIAKIAPHISAERPYFKQAKMELLSLPRYYWQIFGKQELFEVELRLGNKVEKHTLKAIEAINGYEKVRDDILNAKMQIKFFKNAAYLNPGHFSGDETAYQQFIDSAFMEINKSNQKNLIIDLRNNGGGNDSFSDYLVSYIADQPFQWTKNFTLKSSKLLKEHTRKGDTTTTYAQSILSHKDGEVYGYEFDEYQPQPKEKRYVGKVYVLANRQSHSQSAVTAAQMQDYKFGIIVGEETGDYPTLYASIFQYVLPNTGIPVNISKGRIVRVNGSTKEEGVIPDIFIKDYLLDEKDEIMEGLLEKIGE